MKLIYICKFNINYYNVKQLEISEIICFDILIIIYKELLLLCIMNNILIKKKSK